MSAGDILICHSKPMPAIPKAPARGGVVVPLPLASTRKTDLSDESDPSCISNADFLSAIFSSLEGDARPMVCGFAGHPRKNSGGGWVGQPWVPGETVAASPGKNWYFSLATYTPDEDGRYERKKKNFSALFAIMLDDIGTKAKDRSRLDALPPSWLIETSPGNYQAGYIFDTPVSDQGVAEDLIEALINAGLCDPGSNGPVTRNARLPVAVNGKHSPPFHCRLVEWHPERRYAPEDIVIGLDIELPEPVTSAAKAVASGERTRMHHAVHFPRPEENPVITAIKERGLYKKSDGSGKHEITCPWVHEHTDGVDSGTAYFSPDHEHPLGGFKCLHGHCAERDISVFLAELGIDPSLARHQAVIRAIPGEMNRVVDAAEQELAKTGRYFQRGGFIVNLFSDPATRQTTIKTTIQPALLRSLSTVAYWERFDKRSARFVAVDPPPQYVSVLKDAECYSHLPVLNGLARQPYLRADGSLMSESGYDAASGMFGMFDAREFPVSPEPTRADALAALDGLKELLKEFAFAGEADLSAALAGILTAAIRPSLSQAPMFHVKAPQIASGKSYLTTLIAAFASPSSTPATSFPQSDDECQKLLLSTLLEAPPVLCFDNMVTDIQPFKTLCSALTDQSITGRVLGFSKTATVGTRVLFLSSGNNVDPIRDMTRRCITIRLDPGCEIPAERKFVGAPVREVNAERGRFVTMALTIIRAWIVAGRSETKCRSLASYDDWNQYVRQPLLWLGLSDPAESVFTAMAVDPNKETLGRLLAVWWRVFGNRPTLIRSLLEKASRYSSDSDCVELFEVISDIADERGQINRKRLGRWIARNAGRMVGDLRFVEAPKTLNAVQWQVVKSVSSVSSVSTPSSAETVTVAPTPSVVLH